MDDLAVPRISPTPLDDARPILFVGDIQGCAQELDDFLAKAGFLPGDHRLIPVGDTINRGPDAPGVLALLKAAKAEPILGNHELHLLQLRTAGYTPTPADKPNSAARQLAEVGLWPEALGPIGAWPHARTGTGWIAVHAGLHPRLPLRRTSPDFLANVRYCKADGTRPSIPDGTFGETPAGFQPWDAFYTGPDTVIFGHWARRGLTIAGNLRGLDSGCVYGGPLSGLWWPEDRVVQVPSRQPKRPLAAIRPG